MDLIWKKSTIFLFFVISQLIWSQPKKPVFVFPDWSKSHSVTHTTMNQITFSAIFNIHRHLGVKNHSITYGLRLQSVLYKSRNFPESMVLNPPVHVWCSRHVLMIWTLRRIECNDTALTTIRVYKHTTQMIKCQSKPSTWMNTGFQISKLAPSLSRNFY